jgi:CheY-like chemotaxis protein
MTERVLGSVMDYQKDSPRVELLLADHDEGLRALVVSAMSEAVDFVSILEAHDGAEAVRIGLQRRPQLALLDLNMPRLGGLEAALTLRELVPAMRIALNTAGPFFPHERARQLLVPLFDKLEFEQITEWLASGARECRRQLGGESTTHSLQCRVCGYGIATARPPLRCPMCHSEGPWVEAARRPRWRIDQRAQEPAASVSRNRTRE